MTTFRAITNDFQIDNVSMPTPNDFNTVTQIVSTDSSGRLAGSGEMHIEYLTRVFVTTWKYTFMTGDEYDLVYENYINKTVRNKDMYHTLKTIDSNTGNSLTYKIYTQNELNAQLQKLNNSMSRYMGLSFVNGVRVYKDVTFTFVGVGGDA